MTACERYCERQKSPSSHHAPILLAAQPSSGAMRQGQRQSAGARAFSAYNEQLTSLKLNDDMVDKEVVFNEPWTPRSGA